MKLISLKICPFVQRVVALLEAKQISYEIEYIDFNQTPAWFLDISPHLQVPVLSSDSGLALFESEAIIEYLDEIVQPLEPNLSPEQRAIDRAWGYQASRLYLPQCSTLRSQNSGLLNSRTDELRDAFTKVEGILGKSPFYKGEHLSNPDVAWLPLLHRAEIIERYTGYDLIQGYPKMKAWQASFIESGLAEKSVPEDFETVFTGFYLSDKTYLGTGIDHAEDNTLVGSGCGG
ncbi:MAG: glutathione S-transferase family protein [Candidatus Thiodiazotropha endolucinida]